MHKEIIISVIIVICIFTLNYLTHKYTKDSLDTFSSNCDEIREELLKNEHEKEQLMQKTNEIIENWNNRSDTLAFYIEHNELDKVDTYLSTLKGNIETEEYTRAVENIDLCKVSLERLDEKSAFLLKNIF